MKKPKRNGKIPHPYPVYSNRLPMLREGFKEELREINFSIGAEYSYNQQFFLRAGYFNENKYKGNRKYFSFGAGFSLNVLKIDAAYMVATAQTSPLDQTLRFTLSFDMDGLKDLLGRR